MDCQQVWLWIQPAYSDSVKMILRFKYQLIFYYFVVIAILICAFLVYIMQQNRDFSIQSERDELIKYNTIIYQSYKNGVRFENVPIPQGMKVTVIDTTFKVLYHSIDIPLEKNDAVNDEVLEAKATGDGTSLRFSPIMNRQYLFYAKRYPEFYVRTSVPYEYEKVILDAPRTGYQYAIAILIIALVATLFYISNRLTRPLKAFNSFFNMVMANRKDFSSIEFPNNEYGDIGRKIVGTYEQLEQAKQFKQEVTHNIAHELKTPLTGIRAYLETIISDETMPPELMRKFADRAYRQTLRLSSLVNDVSVLNKLDEQSEYYKIEEVNIYDCLKEIEEELSYKLKANNTVFKPLISSELSIRSSHDIIYSLFKNLMDNTLEHAGPNTTITIMAGISQRSGDSNYRINFTYMDNGKGIPDDAADKLFDRFFRVEEGRARKSGGSGLGLAIVKNSVVFHKGDISVDNAPGGGIIFKFDLMSL